MSDSQNAPPIPSAAFPLDQILVAISNPARWFLLREPVSDEQLMVSELAERIGQSFGSTFKNLFK